MYDFSLFPDALNYTITVFQLHKGSCLICTVMGCLSGGADWDYLKCCLLNLKLFSI